MPDPEMPTDTPLISLLAEFEAQGYQAQFVVREGGVIWCSANGHEFAASSLVVDRSRRLEGVSDPADMLMVEAVRCPVCGAAGTLVLHYGPETSPAESEALSASGDHGRGRRLPS